MAGVSALKGVIASSVSRAASARVPAAMAMATTEATTSIAPFRIALVQLTASNGGEEEGRRVLADVQKGVREASANGAKLVVLPEMWNCPYATSNFPIYAEEDTENKQGGAKGSVAALKNIARECSVTLVGGTIPERGEGGKVYNTCYIYGPEGERLGRHRKLHLFDIDIPGKISFFESETLEGGEGVTVVETAVGRLGIGICYDIRFPEQAMVAAQRGAQLLIYPAAFNTTTGEKHFELLQRARAVDTQSYVATCSPARNPEASYQAWGGSSLISPMGEVLATTGHAPSIVYGEVDYAKVDEFRRNIPLESQRRGDVYRLVDVHALREEQ